MTVTPDDPYPWLPKLDETDAEGAVTRAGVLSWLQLDATHEHAAIAEWCRRAAAAHVERVREDLWTDVDADADGVAESRVYTPTDEVSMGAVLLAARLFARRTSPTGLAGYSELGPAEILRRDPDVAMMLGVGRYATPVVG